MPVVPGWYGPVPADTQPNSSSPGMGGGYVDCMEWCVAMSDSPFLKCHTQTIEYAIQLRIKVIN